MEKTLEELQAEATSLDIKFSPNLGAEKLSERIEAYYEALSNTDIVKEKSAEIEEEKVVDVPVSKVQKMRKLIAELKAKAFKKRVVTITSNDKRDNDVVTVAYLGFENQYFGVSKLVPLDVPVELEQSLIDIAKTTMITLHKDEIVDGKRTGNKVPVAVKKLNVSYEDITVK